ncbi:hypothetical protein HMPREF9088_0482 [Enterococcus italicus DSM 15952]|uniref:Uncharacterized protein n=1 Tax=Enterococcus italicus (strain DSM 15952 / CCUG 50447 / LMG 22039 / TP 1.5) TaxID=888064 RepID=E6LDP2_ENTI1|nr:hypothetical protein HMPREF9088_0482 [Enterococcus italicus DSM 15952]
MHFLFFSFSTIAHLPKFKPLIKENPQKKKEKGYSFAPFLQLFL